MMRPQGPNGIGNKVVRNTERFADRSFCIPYSSFRIPYSFTSEIR